ncbi:MAG: hypothetical protein ABSB75_04475 [Candidatus Limnocylindrales bacterium]
MSNLWALTIPDDPDALLVTYGAGALIRVQSSPTSGGTYGAVTTIAIESGVMTYPVYDATGGAGYAYKYRYEASGGAPAGAYCTPFLPTPGHSLYATRAQLKAALTMPATADAVQDPLLDIALAAASYAITDTCERDFSIPSGVSESRYFQGRRHGISYLEIDDLVDDTGLVIATDDGTNTYPTTVTTAYDLMPLNAPAKGFPHHGIAFHSLVSLGVGWPRRPLIKVTSARWGWPAIPYAVEQACLIQAARLYKRKDSPFGIAGSPLEGNVLRLLARLDPDVQMLLDTDLTKGPYIL